MWCSGAINGVTGVTNVGGGSSVLSSVTSGVLIARTISGSGGIDVVESGNNIIVRPVTTTTANRLFFAGEATSSDYAATVHGAFLSGEREAKKIMSAVPLLKSAPKKVKFNSK